MFIGTYMQLELRNLPQQVILVLFKVFFIKNFYEFFTNCSFRNIKKNWIFPLNKNFLKCKTNFYVILNKI